MGGDAPLPPASSLLPPVRGLSVSPLGQMTHLLDSTGGFAARGVGAVVLPPGIVDVATMPAEGRDVFGGQSASGGFSPFSRGFGQRAAQARRARLLPPRSDSRDSAFPPRGPPRGSSPCRKSGAPLAGRFCRGPFPLRARQAERGKGPSRARSLRSLVPPASPSGSCGAAGARLPFSGEVEPFGVVARPAAGCGGQGRVPLFWVLRFCSFRPLVSPRLSPLPSPRPPQAAVAPPQNQKMFPGAGVIFASCCPLQVFGGSAKIIRRRRTPSANPFLHPEIFCRGKPRKKIAGLPQGMGRAVALG